MPNPKSSEATLKAGAPSDDEDEDARKKKSSLVPELPAAVWGKHIAPFLSRKQQNRLRLCRKEILQEMEGIELRWPTIELGYPGGDDDNSFLNDAVTAFTHDSKYLVLAPVPGEERCVTRPPGLYVWNIRSGLQPEIAQNLNGYRAMYRNAYTTGITTIEFSGDDRFLAVHRCCPTYCFYYKDRHNIYDVYHVIRSEETLRLQFLGEKYIDDEVRKRFGFGTRHAFVKQTFGSTWAWNWSSNLDLVHGERTRPFRHPNPDSDRLNHIRVFNYVRHPTNPHIYIAHCILDKWSASSRKTVRTLELIERCTGSGGEEAAGEYCSTILANLRKSYGFPPFLWHPDGQHIIWYDGKFHILNMFAMQKKKRGAGMQKKKERGSRRKRGDEYGDEKDFSFSPPDPWVEKLIEKANTVIQKWPGWWKDRNAFGPPHIDNSIKFSPDGLSMVLTVNREKQLLISVP